MVAFGVKEMIVAATAVAHGARDRFGTVHDIALIAIFLRLQSITAELPGAIGDAAYVSFTSQRTDTQSYGVQVARIETIG